MTANELAARRQAAFKSRSAAARHFDVSPSLFDQYETGKRPIRKIHAIAFDVALPHLSDTSHRRHAVKALSADELQN